MSYSQEPRLSVLCVWGPLNQISQITSSTSERRQGVAYLSIDVPLEQWVGVGWGKPLSPRSLMKVCTECELLADPVGGLNLVGSLVRGLAPEVRC